MELRGWSWKRGEGFRVDGNITEKKIHMGHVEKKAIEASSIEDDTDIKSESDYNDIEKCYKRKREFITIFRRISPYQLGQFNRKYGNEYGKLREQISEEDLYQYVNMAENNRY